MPLGGAANASSTGTSRPRAMSPSTSQMLRQAMRSRYDSVTEAVVDILSQGLQFAIMAAHPMVLGSLLVGGALSGMVALWGHRKLR